MIDFEKRLASLKKRRQGTEEIAALQKSFALNFESAHELLRQGPELFEKLQESTGIKYAIGAMASVGKKYTETSINEGNRVANAVTSSLHGQESVVTRMQGSVALDIHIKGFSDVDMLIICNDPISTQRPHLNPGTYFDHTDQRSIQQILDDIGRLSTQALNSKFHAATVTRGSKSISVDGGSLTRKVDIVPSIWYDSHNYQRSQQDHDRGIQIYDTSKRELICNYPFLHIHRVNQRDGQYNGNLKSLIRLVKNMVADMPEQKSKIAKKLSSYDIAAICYHMEEDLRAHPYFQLGLIEKLRRHLEYISKTPAYKARLDVPDGTRRIFDMPEKDGALETIRSEVNDLARAIAYEASPFHATSDPSYLINRAIYI